MTMDLETSRLILHPVDDVEARRILARAPGPTDAWATDYPFDGDLAAIDSFLRATEQHGEQRPFGYYQVIRAADRLAVGGAGFKGAPQDGRVEIGYGLAPSARGHGYAAEAVAVLVAVAAENGIATVLADTTDDNVASQRTLVNAGFVHVDTDAGLRRYRAPAVRTAMSDDPVALRAWHRVVASKDASLLADLLADEVVFRSPAVFAAQEGKALTTLYLTAALDVLGPTLRYVHQWHDDAGAVLEFEADLDGVVVHGVDMFRWNDEHKLTDFTVMVRPIRGLEQLIVRMGERLAALARPDA